MAIKRAQVLGFCGGVKRAIILAEQSAARKRRGKKLYTVGPLIHNDQELERLSLLGVETVDSVSQVVPGSEVLIRAHGAPREHYEQLKEIKAEVVEGICPLVRDSRNKIVDYSKEGYFIVLAGESKHAEVLGLASFAERGCVISSLSEAHSIQLPERAVLLCQSTWPPSLFQQVVDILTSRYPQLVVENTICSATLERQEALRQLLPQVDALVVVGDRSSSNTAVLYRMGVEAGLPTWLCSSPDDVPAQLVNFRQPGLTAGASAPDWLIDKIEKRMEQLVCSVIGKG